MSIFSLSQLSRPVGQSSSVGIGGGRVGPGLLGPPLITQEHHRIRGLTGQTHAYLAKWLTTSLADAASTKVGRLEL